MNQHPCSGGCGATMAGKFKTCAQCQVLNKKMREARRLERREREGKCRYCENKRLPGVSTCDSHRSRTNAYSTKYYHRDHDVKKVFHCGRCGKPGHMVRTCKMPRPIGVFG